MHKHSNTYLQIHTQTNTQANKQMHTNTEDTNPQRLGRGRRTPPPAPTCLQVSTRLVFTQQFAMISIISMECVSVTRCHAELDEAVQLNIKESHSVIPHHLKPPDLPLETSLLNDETKFEKYL